MLPVSDKPNVITRREPRLSLVGRPRFRRVAFGRLLQDIDGHDQLTNLSLQLLYLFLLESPLERREFSAANRYRSCQLSISGIVRSFSRAVSWMMGLEALNNTSLLQKSQEVAA